MKKIIFTLVGLFALSAVNAQKGTILLAGNVGFGSQSQGTDKASGFNFSPRVGYQFTDHLTVGIDASIGSQKDEYVSGTTTIEEKLNGLNLGAFLRYGMPLSGAFSFYTDLGVGMQSEKASDNVPGSTALKANGFYLSVMPAVAIDLKKSFCLNFSIGGLSYDTMKADTTGAEAVNSFGFNFGQQLNIGISKNF